MVILLRQLGKNLRYSLALLEEGVSYYLIFKWHFVLIAGVIAIFPTILSTWLLMKFGQIGLAYGKLFFIFWCVSLATLVYDCKLPNEYLTRAKEKLKSL